MVANYYIMDDTIEGSMVSFCIKEGFIMSGLMATQEASERWGITERRIRTLCIEGRIEGAKKTGPMWVIPEDAMKTANQRENLGSI